jgi:hypothetical protein
VHLRLESIAGEENPYSLMEMFGKGHQVTLKWSHSLCDQVSASGGHPADSHQLDQPRSRWSTMVPTVRHVLRPHQLCDQDDSEASTGQR